MKHNPFLSTVIVTTLLTFLVACGSSDDDSDGSDNVTDGTVTDGSGTDGSDASIDCGTAVASNFMESESGDLSGEIDAPTPLEVGPGANTVTASTASGDLDYVTFTVGPCDVLTQLTVESFTPADTGDSVAFLAIGSGSTFAAPFEGGATDVSALLGFSHFGFADIGQDILPRVGTGAGTLGFTTPLPAGDYTMWINQTGPETQAALTLLVERVM